MTRRVAGIPGRWRARPRRLELATVAAICRLGRPAKNVSFRDATDPRNPVQQPSFSRSGTVPRGSESPESRLESQRPEFEPIDLRHAPSLMEQTAAGWANKDSCLFVTKEARP